MGAWPVQENGGCKKFCAYGEKIFPDRNQICRNLLSDFITFMLSNFFSDNSISRLSVPIHIQCQLVKNVENRINGLSIGIKGHFGMDPETNGVVKAIC